MIASIIGLFSSLVGEVAEDWKQKRTQKREIARAVTDNKIRLAQSEQSHNQAWEMAVLQGKDVLLRRLSFVLLSVPIIWSGFDPMGAKDYFTDALGALPQWYIQAYLGVLAGIWGLTELRNFKK